MNLDEFAASIEKVPSPVILLEGTRDFSAADRPVLIRTAEKLAHLFPRAVFRSGNAPGSDSAFSEGVQRVDASRMEHLAPYPGHRKRRALHSGKTIAFEEVPEIEQQAIMEKTIQTSPEYRGLVNLDMKNRGWSRYKAKTVVSAPGHPEGHGFEIDKACATHLWYFLRERIKTTFGRYRSHDQGFAEIIDCQ